MRGSVVPAQAGTHRAIARWARALLLVLGLWCAPLAGQAQPGDADYAALAGRDYEAMRAAVERLGTSGDPRAAAVLGALQSGRLMVGPDRTLFIRNPDRTVVEARTGKPAEASGLKEIRMSNAVRRALDAALGGLRLFAPDPATRAAAAQAVFQSRDAAALPTLARALAKETDPGVRRVMEQARAAAVLAASTSAEADRLAAIAVIRARGDLDASSLLASLTNQPPAVSAAAHAGVAAIQRVLRLWDILENVFYGLSLGSVLLLAAAGLAITFGVMGVINMAHGEMVMLGAYTTYVVQQLILADAPALSGASVVLAVSLAFLIAGAVGIAIERGLIRFLYGRPLETLLATWGLSLVLQQAVRSIFGPTNRAVSTPDWMSGATALGGLTLTHNRLAIIVFAVLVFAALMALLRLTPLGLRMRAVTQNRRMAAAMGIRTPWIDALTFGLGSGIAGMAGVALSQIDNVSPNLGQGYIVDSFLVVVFGGVGNLWGTAVGALTLGILNKFLEPVAGAVLGKIVVLVLVILFIQRFPRGMFPLRSRAAEA
ncbi:MAG: urea ABC transporter permease subunit UrtB [Alphaproteobacteria bacterium]|nr:urea ABC transporter permease subunit UrtB [Alphaproteobacteria bacterium]